MRPLDLLRFAAGGLLGHRLRVSLSVVGVAIGIAAVIALTALGEGARRYVMREFTALGSNLLIVIPGKVETTGAIPYGGVTHDLTTEDARAIGSLARVRRAAPLSIGNETVRFEGLGRSAPVLGTSPSFVSIRQLELSSGRFFRTSELDEGSAEVVLGTKVADELFGATSPLGRVVRIGDWRFRVVGVLEPKGRSLGFDMDDLVMVPVATAMSMFNQSSLFRVFVEVREERQMEATSEDILALMKQRHRAEDVTVISQEAVLASFGSILHAMTLALAGIASVSLAVAGVGIMNVMLVSVTERRAEVGLLKALGATTPQILATFLTEAVVLSVLGGLVGLGIGMAAVVAFVQVYPSFPAFPPWWALAAAMTLSVAVGVGFGVWPARRATRLDPVTALSRR